MHDDAECELAVRIEPGIPRCEPHEASRREPGTDKEHDRQGQFGDDADYAETLPHRRRPRGTVAGLQSLCRPDERSLQRGRSAEEDGGDNATASGAAKTRPSIDA